MKKVVLSILLSAVAIAPAALADAKAPATKTAGLGDLSSYVTITKDTLKIAESGDLKAAKERVKDLETAWDEAEAAMRPKSADDWEKADHALDRAFAKLRSRPWADSTPCSSSSRASAERPVSISATALMNSGWFA